MSTGASSPSSESASASDSPSSAASNVGVIRDRIEAVVNQKYKKSGIQSYVWLLQKYNIRPTLDGPYFRPKGDGGWLDKKRHGGLKNLRRHAHKHRTRNPPEKPADQTPAKAKTTSRATGGEWNQWLKDLPSTLPPKYQFPFVQQRDASPSASASASQDQDQDQQFSATVAADAQQNGSLYLCPVTIGGQKLMLDFDSGSSDLWVMSTHLDSSTQSQLKQSGHNIYDPSKSTTQKAMSGSTWDIQYGDGSEASGDVVSDTLVIGTISVEGQAIECAKKLSPAFLETEGDGLLGLAMGTINTVKPKQVATPVDNMISQKDITQSLFTCWLSSWKDADEDDQGKSFYTFGTVDATAMKRCNATDFYWTPLVNQNIRGFWEYQSSTWTLNGQVNPRAAKQKGGNTAIADTGTTLALVDDDTCSKIYAAIPNSRYDYNNQGYVFPINTSEANLPAVGFDVGGKTFFIPKEALLFAETEPGWCYGGIQSRGDLPFDIWGDTWLKGVYACFDQGNKRFGCVQRTLRSQNLSVQ